LEENNEELKKNIKNVNTIMHLASNFRNPRSVYVDATNKLIKIIKEARTDPHIILVSIIGINKDTNYEYYKIKYEEENIIKNSGLKYTILRTSQWHLLIKSFIEMETVNNTINVPRNMSFQSVDIEDVANKLADIAHIGEVKGLLPDLIGPENLDYEEMVKIYIQKSQNKMLTYKKTETSNHADEQLNIVYELFSTDYHFSKCVNPFKGTITWSQYLDKNINEINNY
jgi:hypothetical protein